MGMDDKKKKNKPSQCGQNTSTNSANIMSANIASVIAPYCFSIRAQGSAQGYTNWQSGRLDDILGGWRVGGSVGLSTIPSSIEQTRVVIQVGHDCKASNMVTYGEIGFWWMATPPPFRYPTRSRLIGGTISASPQTWKKKKCTIDLRQHGVEKPPSGFVVCPIVPLGKWDCSVFIEKISSSEVVVGLGNWKKERLDEGIVGLSWVALPVGDEGRVISAQQLKPQWESDTMFKKTCRLKNLIYNS